MFDGDGEDGKGRDSFGEAGLLGRRRRSGERVRAIHSQHLRLAYADGLTGPLDLSDSFVIL